MIFVGKCNSLYVGLTVSNVLVTIFRHAKDIARGAKRQRTESGSLRSEWLHVDINIGYIMNIYFCLAFKDDSITIQHISLAISGVYNNRVAHCIEELPLQQKATVATLVVMSHQKENHVTLEKVWLKYYKYVCIYLSAFKYYLYF